MMEVYQVSNVKNLDANASRHFVARASHTYHHDNECNWIGTNAEYERIFPACKDEKSSPSYCLYELRFPREICITTERFPP